MADIDAPLYWRMQQDGYLMQINQLRDENAKLRELCADIYKGFRGVVFECWSYSSEDFRMYERCMRKLGIEID